MYYFLELYDISVNYNELLLAVVYSEQTLFAS